MTTRRSVWIGLAAVLIAAVGPLDGVRPAEAAACSVRNLLREGMQHPQVNCLERRLQQLGYQSSYVDNYFGTTTVDAVQRYRQANGFDSRGDVGRGVAQSLGIWGGGNRRRAPIDWRFYPASPVSSRGDAAPRVPSSSGRGRRLVYSRASQRAWAVEAGGGITRSWLVSGSKYGNDPAGTYRVFSRSPRATSYGGTASMNYMIRYSRTPNGNNLGFHDLPRRISDGSLLSTVAQLGQRLSAGCVRQAEQDARFLWGWAPVGTVVVVV